MGGSAARKGIRRAPVGGRLAALVGREDQPRDLELRIVFVIGRVSAILGALLLAGGCRGRSPQEAGEAALREILSTLRSTLHQYHGDKGTYPASLKDLLEEGYLRAIPVDPVTRSRETWRVTYEYPGTPGPGQSSRFVVVEVRSGSAERAVDGTPYRSW